MKNPALYEQVEETYYVYVNGAWEPRTKMVWKRVAA